MTPNSIWQETISKALVVVTNEALNCNQIYLTQRLDELIKF